MKKVSDCMTRDVRTINPDMTIQQAAQIMARTDTGALPVGENDRLIGMLTDRDIAVRAVCHGRGPETTVREVMSQDTKYCYEDEGIEHVAHNMGEIQVRRLPVMSRDKRLVGIIALGDIARRAKSVVAGDALEGISKPGGQHSQTAH